MGQRITTLLLALGASIALLGLTACASGGASDTAKATTADRGLADFGPLADVTDGSPAAQSTKAAGPAIQVTWEALAREKYLLENSRFRRRGQPQPPQRITLFSASHPTARDVKRARSKEDRERFAGSAVLSDADMLNFLRGLQKSGFYNHAKPTGYSDALAGSDNARGRIIVDQDGRSYTLLSMRGQGQNKATSQIPKLYSETKQAVMVLRNMTPTLNVTHYGVSGSAR